MSQVAADLRPRRPAARLGHSLPHVLRALPWTQVALVTAAIVTYFSARGITASDPAPAHAHAEDVVAFERWAHLYHEPALQERVVGSPWVVDLLNWVYIWGHWPVLIGTLLWIVRTHPEGYRLLRNALFVSGAIGLVVFITYPVAPPRLMDLGLVDTVSEQSQAYRVLQPPSFTNQYAAVPSLHVGWNLLVGIVIVRYAKHRLARAFGWLSPVAMTIAVVLTANHYIVDAILGSLVALVGLLVATRLAQRARPSP